MKQQNDIEVITLQFEDDGAIPNNPTFPVLIYKNAMDSNDQLTEIINENQWGNSWVNGVFPYHHFHSNAHELLIVMQGEAQVRLGGEQGETVHAETGDVVILPAGTGHKRLDASSDFKILGAYPNGDTHDMCYGEQSERPQSLENIKSVPLPQSDPIYGKEGPLFEHWKA